MPKYHAVQAGLQSVPAEETKSQRLVSSLNNIMENPQSIWLCRLFKQNNVLLKKPNTYFKYIRKLSIGANLKTM